MPSPGQELSSIDFESMIGGPLVAVINAQAQAAMSTVNFIKEVGFKNQVLSRKLVAIHLQKIPFMSPSNILKN